MRNKTQIYLEFLVIKSQDGDTSALGELIEYWQPRLLRYAWFTLYDKDALDDILQEVWIAAVKGLRNLEDPSCFRAWIYRIVTCKCADWLRKKKRMKEQSMDLLENKANIDSEEHCDTEEIDMLRKAIHQLSKDHKIIVSLFYLEEMGLKEIAQILNIPEGTVKSRLHHARLELKEKMKGYK